MPRTPVSTPSAAATPARSPRNKPVGIGPALALPHERDQAANSAGTAPRKVMLQAKRDIDAGLVDTDMRATPGLDAERRAQMVPTPGAAAKSAPKSAPKPAPKRRASQA